MCKGTDEFYGNKISCYGGEVHGKVNLNRAFSESCNGAFANIGLKLNTGSFKVCAKNLDLTENYPLILNTKKAVLF